jgi:hypothetical protein
MAIISIVFLILWLACGVYCLYHMDFSMDIKNGFSGAMCILGITLLMFVIGPLCVREIHRVNYP